MSTLDVIRAWKDELFRKSLNEHELALLPAHPSGEILLSAEEMAAVQGGLSVVCATPGPDCTCRPCTPLP